MTTAVIKVEQGRLGVLSSHEAYLVEFKETAPSSSAHVNGPARQLTRVDEEGEFQLVYLWVGARAGVDACEAARAQVRVDNETGLCGVRGRLRFGVGTPFHRGGVQQ